MPYDPRYVYLYPASIPQIVAHIQDYLKDNPIVSTATITQMIINELSEHPEVLNGSEIPITAEDQQSIKEYIDHLPSVDGYTKEQVNALLDEKQDILTFDQSPTSGSSNPVTSSGISAALNNIVQVLTLLINAKANSSDVYTKSVIDQLLSGKANVIDVYTKTVVDTLLGNKANSADVYTKTQTDTLLADKADADDVYTKTQTDTLLGDKANAADVYTKTQTDTLLADKADADEVTDLKSALTYPQEKIESYGIKNISLAKNNSAQVDLINAVLKAGKSYKVYIEFTSIESGENIYLYAIDENNNSMWKAGLSIGFNSSMLTNTYSLVIPQSDTKIRIYAVARRAGILKEAYIITEAFDDYVTEDYFEQSKINIFPYDQSAYEYGGIDNTTGENTSQDRSIRTKEYINVTDTSLYCIYGGTGFGIYCFCYTDSAFLSRIDLRNNSANNPLPSGTKKVKFVIYNESKYNNNNILTDYIPDEILVAENSKYTDYVDNRVIKSNLIDDRSIGKAKFVRHTIDEDLIHEDSIGEYSLNPQYVTFNNSLANLLPTNDYWELGYWNGTGAGTVPGQSYHTKSVRTKASKLIEIYSEAKINVKDFSSNTYQVTLNFYDENSDFLEQKGFLTNIYTERVYTAPINAKYLRISIFNDEWTVSDATVKDYVPFKLQLTIGERQATDVCPIVINTEHIDEHGIPLDKLEEEYPVPSYYFVNEYLQDKAARIKELAQAAGADGDTFIFISDMHWDKSVPHQSPNIIRYLSEHIHLPRVFNGGDVGDTGNADGADAIRKALYPTHEHHIACGNHEWFAHVTGDKLYYDYDIFNNDQIGNANRHYFYVDNVQNKVRYVVLSSHSEMEPDGQAAGYGYEQEQLDWFENIALNVESGWKILVFAHEVIGLQTWSKDSTYGIFSYAQPMIDICDAYQGNGTICAILCGDQHVDRIGYTSTDIPIVCTTCDTNTPSLLPSDDQIRTTGTINEGAFDVVILNGNTKTIHFVRIGAKAYNRIVDSGTEYVEERTVQYP